MALLQTYFDIQQEKEKIPGQQPDLSLLRQVLFWDTDINKIDWQKQYRAVIQRVYERGNETEQHEMVRFYGTEKVEAALQGRKAAQSY
jgi:antitoxin HigA-1